MTISDSTFFSRLRIVLIETSHPGNIGAAARAMKTMGLSQLCLVNPRQYPSAEAITRASGADDLLTNAPVFASLEQALVGCSWVFGTTARSRSMAWNPSQPREAMSQAVSHLRQQSGDVAVVFGRESSGLRNDELERCHQALHIPANADYSSLNLAAAVQIIAYEARQAISAPAPMIDHAAAGAAGAADADSGYDPLVNHEQLEGLYQHLLTTLAAVSFYDTDQPGKLESRLRALFSRTALRRSELQILRGFCAAVQRKLGD